MAKRALHLYVDSELIEIAKAKDINLSQMFNEVLKQTLEMPDQTDHEGADLKKQIKKMTYEKALKEQELRRLRAVLEQKQKEDEMKLKDRRQRTTYEGTV